MKIRVGFGFDVHKFAENRELWLGGIRLEHDRGLLGHSDADVLIHAICDALLGAAHLRDIGYHFPDTAGEFKNITGSIICKELLGLTDNCSAKGEGIHGIPESPVPSDRTPEYYKKRPCEELVGISARIIGEKINFALSK